MGEELFTGISKIYVGDEPIDMKVHGTDLLAVDPAEEVCDNTGLSVWNNGSVEIQFTINSDDNPLGKWWLNMVRRFNAEKKALFYALTHGYVIRVTSHDDEGNEGYIELDRPSQLRMVMKMVKFIPDYKIYDKKGKRFIVKKGRIVKMPSFNEIIFSTELPATNSWLNGFLNKSEL